MHEATKGSLPRPRMLSMEYLEKATQRNLEDYASSVVNYVDLRYADLPPFYKYQRIAGLISKRIPVKTSQTLTEGNKNPRTVQAFLVFNMHRILTDVKFYLKSNDPHRSIFTFDDYNKAMEIALSAVVEGFPLKVDKRQGPLTRQLIVNALAEYFSPKENESPYSPRPDETHLLEEETLDRIETQEKIAIVGEFVRKLGPRAGPILTTLLERVDQDPEKAIQNHYQAVSIAEGVTTTRVSQVAQKIPTRSEVEKIYKQRMGRVDTNEYRPEAHLAPSPSPHIDSLDISPSIIEKLKNQGLNKISYLAKHPLEELMSEYQLTCADIGELKTALRKIILEKTIPLEDEENSQQLYARLYQWWRKLPEGPKRSLDDLPMRVRELPLQDRGEKRGEASSPFTLSSALTDLPLSPSILEKLHALDITQISHLMELNSDVLQSAYELSTGEMENLKQALRHVLIEGIDERFRPGVYKWWLKLNSYIRSKKTKAA